MDNNTTTYKINPRVYLAAGLAIGYFVGQRYNVKFLAKKVGETS